MVSIFLGSPVIEVKDAKMYRISSFIFYFSSPVVNVFKPELCPAANQKLSNHPFYAIFNSQSTAWSKQLQVFKPCL